MRLKAIPNESARRMALSANITGYEERDERHVISGSPHLAYAELRAIYDRMVSDALAAFGREPSALEVLELGAGDGLASWPWFERRVALTAVDCSRPMLGRFVERAAEYGVRPTVVEADAREYLASQAPSSFDLICFVSMLHHIPDYLGLLRDAKRLLRPGGGYLTFQDPLRYDRIPVLHHRADRLFYFVWRLGQGNLKRGLKTRIRRLRGIYSIKEAAADFSEYHADRNGVDSEAIVRLLDSCFRDVHEVRYWSNQASLGQAIGTLIKLQNVFGVIAVGYQSAAAG